MTDYQIFLHPGQALRLPPTSTQESNSVISNNGLYRFILQTDGNLVLYQELQLNSLRPLWHSHTAGYPGVVCYMQTDGNLVLYTAGNVVLWHSHTAGHPGAYLAVQDDGNAVVYAPGNVPIWQTDTAQ